MIALPHQVKARLFFIYGVICILIKMSQLFVQWGSGCAVSDQDALSLVFKKL